MAMRFHSFFICALLAVMVCACEKNSLQRVTLEQGIAQDFNHRYPRATITEVNPWDNGKNRITDIYFTDKEGFSNIAIYRGDNWLMTQKSFDVDDFMRKVPSKVYKTYLKTGIIDEDYHGESFSVIEITRNGLDKKQYEFHCAAPYDDGVVVEERFLYHIIIDEDGTLLSLYYDFNPSIRWYDMESSIKSVRDKYPDATLLGAVNESGNNVLFIRDNGSLKKVTSKNIYGDGFMWTETRYVIDVNSTLPATVKAAKDAYEAEHPDEPFIALYFVEKWDVEGSFYGLCYGTILQNHTFFIEAE